MKDFKNLIDLESSIGGTTNNLSDMEGALSLFDGVIEDMRNHPEAAASLVENGEIVKQLSAINAMLKNEVQDSKNLMKGAQRNIQEG